MPPKACLAPGVCSADLVQQMNSHRSFSRIICGARGSPLHSQSGNPAPGPDLWHWASLSPSRSLRFFACKMVTNKPRPGGWRVEGVKVCKVLPAMGAEGGWPGSLSQTRPSTCSEVPAPLREDGSDSPPSAARVPGYLWGPRSPTPSPLRRKDNGITMAQLGVKNKTHTNRFHKHFPAPPCGPCQ